MTYRTAIKRYLLLALFVLAAGGFLLHARIHPYQANHSNLVALLSGALAMVVVPLFYLFRKTLPFGYVLNGMLVIIGTVVMGHYTLVHPPEQLTVGTLLTKTLFADILILWGNFYIGKALFDLEVHGSDLDKAPVGHLSRFPNNGWWLVHLILISLVYWAGHRFWR